MRLWQIIGMKYCWKSPSLKINNTRTASTKSLSLAGLNHQIGSNTAARFGYDHDASGRITTWERRLDGVDTTLEFSYSPFSELLESVLQDSTNAITSHERYLWADGHQPSEERAANGTTVECRHHHQSEQRIGSTDAGLYYYSHDYHGSIRKVTGATGTIRARYDYDPYGKRLTQYQSSTYHGGCEFGYTGHFTIPSPVTGQTEIVLTHFRAYDPELGRWRSADPIGEAGGLN
jgi:RHS repeat-associated protein